MLPLGPFPLYLYPPNIKCHFVILFFGDATTSSSHLRGKRLKTCILRISDMIVVVRASHTKACTDRPISDFFFIILNKINSLIHWACAADFLISILCECIWWNLQFLNAILSIFFLFNKMVFLWMFFLLWFMPGSTNCPIQNRKNARLNKKKIIIK